MNLLRAARNWGPFVFSTIREGLPAVVECLVTRQGGAARHHMYQWCGRSCDGLGIRRRLEGAANLDAAPQAVIVANHQSYLDILVIGSFLARDYRWLAKSALFHVPVMGWYIALAGHVPVYRGKQKGRNRELGAAIHRVVEEGASLLFFPEGTRSGDGRLQPFKMGAFLTAAREALPVLPIVVRGTGQLLGKGAWDLDVHSERDCRVTVLPPIAPPSEGDVEARAVALRDAAFSAMTTVLHDGG